MVASSLRSITSSPGVTSSIDSAASATSRVTCPCLHFSEVAHAAQQAVGDARRARERRCDLQRTGIFHVHVEQVRGARDDARDSSSSL